MRHTRPTDAYLENETEEQKAARLARMASQPSLTDGDTIRVYEYDNEGTVTTSEVTVEVKPQQPPVVLVNGERIPVPVFVGRFGGGSWEVKRGR